MHRIKQKRWSKLLSTAGILAIAFGGLVMQSSRAVSANPTPVCVGANCTITFGFTGDFYTWTPPAEAQNLTFDVMGAQGGRSGGLGGRVTGTLLTGSVPLNIYVGGAGAQGSGAAGGFNGGGTAGAGRGDEGSGGGASDIRLGATLASRLVVAAGGGGSGGYSGGVGGIGGGTSGGAGTSGQGQAGSGASQSAGGNGGFPNGGSWGGNGDFGIGGSGGSSSVSGGGGGGGGYYGGGGGGADVDSCCSNAGGGGGGSSWVDATKTSSVTNTAGYRSGAGLVIISYSLPPSVVSFAASTTTSKSSDQTFNLTFNQTVTGLSVSDLSVVGVTCSSSAVTGSGSTYSVTLSGCSEGSLSLRLAANSVSGVSLGPAQTVSAADVVIDYTSPVLAVIPSAAVSNELTNIFQFQANESINIISPVNFLLTGVDCSIDSIAEQENRISVSVSSCADNQTVSLNLLEGSVTDDAGNSAPGQNLKLGEIRIDRTSPNAIFAIPAKTEVTISPNFSLSFSEPVTGVTAANIEQRGSAAGCVIGVVEKQQMQDYEITTSECGLGTVQLALIDQSFVDAAGNKGSAALSAVVEVVASAPAPVAPTPVPVTSTDAQAPVESPQSPSGNSTPNESLPRSESSVPSQNIQDLVLPPAQDDISSPVIVRPSSGSIANINQKLVTLNDQIAAIAGDEAIPELGDLDTEAELDVPKTIELDNPAAAKPASSVFSFSGWLYQSWQLLTFGLAGAATITVASVAAVRRRRLSRQQGNENRLDLVAQLRPLGSN